MRSRLEKIKFLEKHNWQKLLHNDSWIQTEFFNDNEMLMVLPISLDKAYNEALKQEKGEKLNVDDFALFRHEMNEI